MEKTLKTTDISILNLANYSQGETIKDAFVATLDLAQKAEALGYKRFWLAEHHNLEGIASASTAVLIGHVAGGTKTIRVGSGGIMLPNHSPYVIAEQFGTLATLYPERIDLGLGRAPGTDHQTMRAVRGAAGSRGDDFHELIDELLYYFAEPKEGQKIRAFPGAGMKVPVWILGSSLYSARLAAIRGFPYAFAGHFAPQEMSAAFELYRREFTPSVHLKEPRVMMGVQVVAADTDAEADYLASSVLLRFLSLIRGNFKPTPPPVKDVRSYWTPQEEYSVRSMTQSMIIGGPEKVRRDLDRLINTHGADEVIITCDLFAHEKRQHSYELVAREKFD